MYMHLILSSLVVVLAATAIAAPSESRQTNRAVLVARQTSDDDSNPPFPPAGQATPQLLIDNPDLFYWPNVTAEDGSAPDNLPPTNQTDGVNPLGKNWFGTGLFGYDECKKRNLDKAKIDDAYYDMWYLVNRDGIFKDIDWNSAAALEFLGPPANNKDYQSRMQNMLAYAASTSEGWKNVHYIHVRCDDPADECTKGCNPDGTPIESDTIAYTQQEDDNGYTSMNFCPRFFGMNRLRDAALDYGKGRPYPGNAFLNNYDNTARVFLHELFHADYFMSNSGANHVWDMTMALTGRTDTVDVYGPTWTKVMAKFQPLQDINQFHKAGWYVSRNADNMAWFATAKYVQDKTGTYPHLPIVYQKIDGPPWKKVGFFTSYTNGTDPTFNVTSVDPAFKFDSTGCVDVTSDANNKGVGPSPIPTLNITGMADDSLYPADYIKNITAWIAQDLEDTTSTSTSSISSSATPVPTCTGNQVQGSCTAGTLPSATPFSGPQGPSCLKADGDPGTAARLSASKASTGASQYCDSLISSKVVLSDSSTGPKPAIFTGQAEGGKDMVMTVLYDQSSCPTDKSNSTLDFTAFGRQACYDQFYTVFDEVCAQDSTWQNYNADYTIEGGVFGFNCGLFALSSQ